MCRSWGEHGALRSRGKRGARHWRGLDTHPDLTLTAHPHLRLTDGPFIFQEGLHRSDQVFRTLALP